MQTLVYYLYSARGLVLRMAHREWKETKQEPGTARPGNMLGCCLISFHFLWAILSRSTVCPFKEKTNCLFMNRHSKRSALYLLRRSRRFSGCCEIRLTSRRLCPDLNAPRPSSSALFTYAWRRGAHPKPKRPSGAERSPALARGQSSGHKWRMKG